MAIMIDCRNYEDDCRNDNDDNRGDDNKIPMTMMVMIMTMTTDIIRMMMVI